MKIRIVFGYLFFLLSISFCGIQLGTLPTAGAQNVAPMVLQFSTALVCLLLASLAAQSRYRTGTIAISVVAFSVSFLALLSAGILAIHGTSEMTTLKYILLLTYAGLYGAFGFAFSFLTGSSRLSELTQRA